MCRASPSKSFALLSVIALSCALLPRVQVKAGWLHQDQEPLRRTGGASRSQAGGFLQTGVGEARQQHGWRPQAAEASGIANEDGEGLHSLLQHFHKLYMLIACASIEHSEHEYIRIMMGSWVSTLCLAVSQATWNPCLAAVHFLLIQASVSVDWNRFAGDSCYYAQQCFLLHNALCES